jgi:hypothetical protein
MFRVHGLYCPQDRAGRRANAQKRYKSPPNGQPIISTKPPPGTVHGHVANIDAFLFSRLLPLAGFTRALAVAASSTVTMGDIAVL